MRLPDVFRSLLLPARRRAYVESRVIVGRQGGQAMAFELLRWREGAGGNGALRPSGAWDMVSSGGRNRKLSPDYGVSATRARTRLPRWNACVREGAQLAPVVASCEVQLTGMMPDLRDRVRIRGECVGLAHVWLSSAADQCDDCVEAIALVVVHGIDGDYVAWSCEPRADAIERQVLIDALAAQYRVPVEFE